MKNFQEKEIITKEKFLSNWNMPIFINYPYKEVVNFIKKEFFTKNNDLLTLIRLYKEVCIMQKEDSQKGFNIFLSEDINEKATTEELLYLIQNIKRLLYYMSDEINKKKIKDEINDNIDIQIYNSFINENSLLYYLKKNFGIFLPLFKSGSFNEKNKTKDEKELDKKFKDIFGFDNDVSKFLQNNNKDMNNKMEIEEEKDIDNIDNKNADEIKIEIINIYNFILNSYNDLEKPEEDIINFSQILIKYLVIYLNKNKENDVLKKLKKSVSLLIGIYVKIIKSDNIICHPIKIIFQQILNFLIKTVLFVEVKENNEKEIDNYFQIILSIYNILLSQNSKNLLIDLQNIILYYSKQLIYENVDCAQFRSPLELKNINGLNELNKKIIYHPYLFNILSLLDEENANSFLGFYIRFFHVSEKNKLFCCKENIIKCLEYFINIKWIPNEYKEFVIILKNKNIEFDKIKKINEYIYLYLRTNKLLQDKENNSKETESKKKACEKLKYLYKNIILENINSLN